MIIHSFETNHTSRLILASCVAIVGAAMPAAAQTVNFPSPAFPKEGTPWGCHFFGTCQTDDVVAENNWTHVKGECSARP